MNPELLHEMGRTMLSQQDRIEALERDVRNLEALMGVLDEAFATKPGWPEIRQLHRRIDNAVHGPLTHSL